MYQENIFLRPGQSIDDFISETSKLYGIHMRSFGVACLGKLLASDIKKQIGHFDESVVHLTLDLVELYQVGGLDPNSRSYMVTKLVVKDAHFLVTASWRGPRGLMLFGGGRITPTLGGNWQGEGIEAWFNDLKEIPHLVEAF